MKKNLILHLNGVTFLNSQQVSSASHKSSRLFWKYEKQPGTQINATSHCPIVEVAQSVILKFWNHFLVCLKTGPISWTSANSCGYLSIQAILLLSHKQVEHLRVCLFRDGWSQLQKIMQFPTLPVNLLSAFSNWFHLFPHSRKFELQKMQTDNRGGKSSVWLINFAGLEFRVNNPSLRDSAWSTANYLVTPFHFELLIVVSLGH